MGNGGYGGSFSRDVKLNILTLPGRRGGELSKVLDNLELSYFDLEVY